MTTYRTTYGSTTIEISADWAQAACSISGGGLEMFQVADFRQLANERRRRVKTLGGFVDG